MIQIHAAVLCRLIPYRYSEDGNRSDGKSFLPLQQSQTDLLNKLLLKPFSACTFSYCFAKGSFWESWSNQVAEGLDIEEILPQVTTWLSENLPEDFLSNSESFIAEFDNVQMSDEAVRGIGFYFYKSREDFMTLQSEDSEPNINFLTGWSGKKADLAFLLTFPHDIPTLLILNQGFLHSEVSIHELMSLESKRDAANHTHNILNLTKAFIVKQIPEEFEVEKTDQIDLLNRSVEYFKTKENYVKEEFEEEVFQNPSVIESFRKFDDSFSKEHNIEVEADFKIAPEIVKKQSKVFKSVLKLDKNFHIYIHGNREMIEKCEDENGRKFYKIFFENEF